MKKNRTFWEGFPLRDANVERPHESRPRKREEKPRVSGKGMILNEVAGRRIFGEQVA
jgi:hypothetical protein